MKKTVPYISLFFIVSSLFMFFAFRQTPKGELWQGYSILYVPTDADETDVQNILYQFDITDFTCLSNQYLPTSLTADSIEISLLSFNQNALDYLSKRNNYFFDKSHAYKLYYVPVEYSSKLSACVSYLNKNDVLSGVDSSTSYPILLPVCVFVFAAALSIFAKNKLLYISTSLLSVFFSICFPYLSCAVSAIFLLLILFVCVNVFKRRGAVKLLSRKTILIALAFISILSAFTATVLSGVMFVLLLAGTFCSYLMYDFLFEKFRKKASFNPVLIRSAKFIPQFAGKEKIIFPLSIILVCVIFAVSVFSIDSLSVSSDSISLPSSIASIQAENLPNLEDYAKWDFIVKSYPYRSINSEDDADAFSPVSFYRYSASGRNIVETQEILSFNSDFVDNSISQIDDLNFNSIEKILKSQDSDFISGYSVSGSQTLSLFSIILVIAQFLCLSFLYIKTVLKKHRGNK